MLNLMLMILKDIKLKLSRIHINQNGMKNLLCMLIEIIVFEIIYQFDFY